MKNLLYEKVTVIHAGRMGAPKTVAFVEVKKDATTAEKLEVCVLEDQQHHGCMVEQEGVTKMFVGATCRSTMTVTWFWLELISINVNHRMEWCDVEI